MTEGPHRTQIDDAAEDVLHRLMQTTQNIQTKIFRLSRRGFLTAVSVGQLRYDAESIAREVGDLTAMVALKEENS